MIRTVLLLVLLALPGFAAAQSAKCTLLLKVRLTPDVENPKDPAFLSALVGDPAYSLVLVSASDYTEVLRLSGPPNSCRKQLEIMRRNAYVIDISVMDNEGAQ
jgi:hypothetical protein